nr:MAG TPA: major coat protein [Inoviridae sp.]
MALSILRAWQSRKGGLYILPIAAGIAGGFIAVKLGFKYFKGLAK